MYCSARGVVCCCCFLQQRAAVCSVRHSFQNYVQWNGNKITILCQSEHQKIPPHPKRPRLKNHVFSSRNPMYLPAATINTKGAMCAAHITATHLSAGIDGVRTHASISHTRTSAGVLCLASNGDWRSRSLKNYVAKDEEDRTGLGCELLY